MKKPLIINIGFTSDDADRINQEINDGIKKLREKSGLSKDIIEAIEKKESEG